MKKLIPLLILTLLGLSLSAISSADLYKKLQGAYKGLSSYQANVSQSNYYPQLKKTITYTGKLYFTPGKMLMHFEKPNLQRLHIEAGQVTLYDALSNTIFTSAIQPQYGRMNPLEILQLYWDRSSVKLGKQKGDLVDVTLTPAKDAMLSSLSATINSKNGQVQKLSYKDAGGNTVSYSFSGIKLNGGISASVWKFSYPKTPNYIDQ
jgi:outer membrane lipoprotein-sorting protein